MKRAFVAALAMAALLHLAGRRVPAQSATVPPLDFLRSIFVTGDAAVFGTALNPSGNGTIQIDGVPTGKDVVAAFLYWQAITRQDTPDAGGMGATFRGNPI